MSRRGSCAGDARPDGSDSASLYVPPMRHATHATCARRWVRDRSTRGTCRAESKPDPPASSRASPPGVRTACWSLCRKWNLRSVTPLSSRSSTSRGNDAQQYRAQTTGQRCRRRVRASRYGNDQLAARAKMRASRVSPEELPSVAVHDSVIEKERAVTFEGNAVFSGLLPAAEF